MGITRIGPNLFSANSAWHPPMASPVSRARQAASSGKKKPDGAKDRKKAEDAAAFIKKKLDDSGWFDTVSTGDLKQITAKLKELRPAQRNLAIGELSNDTLHKWADEIGSPWLGTGLNGDQKFDLFNTLVPSLDGANLTRLGTELTDADADVARKEFILSVAGGATAKAREAYQDALLSGDFSSDEFFDQDSVLSGEGALQKRVADIIDGDLGHRQLVELSNILDCFPRDERAYQFFDDGMLFSSKRLNRLAERISNPDEDAGLNRKEKQRLFDLMSASMTGKQLADMQTALTAHDFIRAMDTNARLRRETGQGQPMNSTDELGKVLENYTNRKSLEREANDPSNFSWLPVFGSEAQSLAKKTVPHIPQIKAKVPDAPMSANGELFFQSLLKTNKADSQKIIDARKTEYMTRISNHPINPELESTVKAASLDLAMKMVAQRSAALIYNEMGAEEGNTDGARDMKLFGDVTTRQQKIRKTEYFSEQYSTEENDVSDAKWLVGKAEKQLDQYSRQFGMPHALLAGVLAAEVDFDTPLDIRDPGHADFINESAFRAHRDSAATALAYLGSDKVKADLQAAKLDGAIDYLDSSSVKEFLAGVRHDDSNGALFDKFKEKPGPMEINYASIITLKLAHEMWDAGKKIPASNTPDNFGTFLKNLSSTQMASIYRGYRAGTDTTGGYRNYDVELGLHKVSGGDDFARAIGDRHAVMGYQAYQAEPYFEYYLKSGRS